MGQATNHDHNSAQSQPGCLLAIVNALWRGVLRLLGWGVQGARATIIPADEKYQEYVDTWVSERIALWLHETRPEIDAKIAADALTGKISPPSELMVMINQTLIDAKVTFEQRNGKQFLQIEAYMSPRQMNGRQPQLLRWRAEREIAWQDIPDTVREKLIRLRAPVTLDYSIPGRS
ncbi:MAG: hypothetical protein IAE83_12900 [Anaerolinea sp.]|nr:hypothetical protein [Anaerolinea sp.]MCC6976287.1 hypothetical protein [Anaerolineae bacterium]CAG1014405.1 hypothetical protein ANRL4_05206 [Anaerolineae bacterium]